MNENIDMASTEAENDQMNPEAVAHAFKPVTSATLEELERATLREQRELSVDLDDVGLLEIARRAVLQRDEGIATP